ncbi:transcriptional regulator [Enterococcus sp. JM4C]|uniref:helix-turn-helix transcriptional regulator n=1 Tax=Candidatus Enterococcus huntleyi TaxID=1857217 RepID=UPI00137B605F|nr:YafY family protein [Enterococcus sp. JM4C]KAF1295549.1 transcriptional regulator [Enterococcus sp. JM4C]
MKIERVISIILMLLEKKRISAQQLADTFEVSLRTIYRDLETIDRAGIPIHSIPGVGGGYEIMPKYKLDKQVFSAADITAILTGLTSVSTMIHENERASALAKVKHFIPDQQARAIELKTNQLVIDLQPWLGSRTIQPYLEIIKQALKVSQQIAFEYVNLKGQEATRIIEPYQLVVKNSSWYLCGYCLEKQDFRLFKLTRMTNLSIQSDSFTPREFPAPQLEFTQDLANLQIEIKLRIHHSLMERMLDYCAYEEFLPDGATHYLVNFPFIENDYYYNQLLSFGSKCECLGPEYIRQGLKQRIRELTSLYENDEVD